MGYETPMGWCVPTACAYGMFAPGGLMRYEEMTDTEEKD